MIGGTGGEGGEGKVGPGREGLMACWPARGVRCRRRRILLALALSCQGCGLQNWRLWRLRRLCSVMAGGTARPAAAEGEAGHEPGTGWPGPQVAALGRGARAHGRPSRLGIYGEPPMSRWRSAFPRSFRPSNRRKRRIAHVMELAKLVTVLPTFQTTVRIFARPRAALIGRPLLLRELCRGAKSTN